jgi:hypothetical protein
VFGRGAPAGGSASAATGAAGLSIGGRRRLPDASHWRTRRALRKVASVIQSPEHAMQFNSHPIQSAAMTARAGMALSTGDRR